MRLRLSGLAWLAVLMAAGCSSCPASNGAKVVDPVDINHATVTELLHVPGMTATWAARIVRFRPYRTKLDLLDQGIVSPEVYARIRGGIVAHRSEK